MANAPAEIFDAVQANDLDRVRRLVAQSPDVARARGADGVSVLMFAQYRARADALRLLRGTDPELDIFEAAAFGETARLAALLGRDPGLARAFSPDGFTALGLASFFGQLPAARMLLEQGAEVNAVARNPMKVMPLHAAAAGRHLAICELLLAHGANVNAAQEGGYTPLHEAAHDGNRPLADLLLAHGADRALTKDDGKTPADLAVESGHQELAALLRTPS